MKSDLHAMLAGYTDRVLILQEFLAAVVLRKENRLMDALSVTVL